MGAMGACVSASGGVCPHKSPAGFSVELIGPKDTIFANGCPSAVYIIRIR